MRIREFDHGLDLAKSSVGAVVRSPGLHASDLYNEFYKDFDAKRYDKRDAQGNPIPMDLAKMELGTAFEEILEPVLAERLLGGRPGEFRSPEGIYFSPDYLFEEDDLVLGEFKCTWYSMRNAPEDPKFGKWFTQIKLYCHWLQIRRARLYVFFVNGDYKPPCPKLRAWEMVFHPRELKDEFDLITRDARRKGTLK